MKNTLKSAYFREAALLSIVMKMEKVGVPLHPEIEDIASYWEKVHLDGDKILKKTLGPNVSIGGKLMFNRFNELGLIDESKIEYTPKGNPRYGREFIDKLVKDNEIASILKKRSKLTKVIGTYLRPWADSYANYRRLHPYFNQVRNLEDRGTRTGRFSSNLQQIPKEPDPELVDLRSLIYPEAGEILLVRDFSAQEIRVAAHYAEGDIMNAYNLDPDMDVHEFIQKLILEKTGVKIERRVSKSITFLKLYGGGAKLAGEMLEISESKTRDFFKAYDAALPSFKTLANSIEQMVRGGTMLRTWGGRLYDVEPSEIKNGKKWEKYYKMMNVLIQGSSADMTKESMVRYDTHPDKKGRLMLQVHDELVISVDPKYKDSEMKILKWSMDDMPGWDVPIRSSGDYGPSYGELTKW